MVMIPLVCGAGLGLGVWLCARALHPRPQHILVLLTELDRPGRPISSPRTQERVNLDERAARLAERALGRIGLTPAGGPDLDLVGRTVQRHALAKVTAALAGLLVTSLGGLALGAIGAGPSTVFLLALSIVAALAGFVFPDLSLRDQAAQRRKAFRHALSAYFDLVNILLAGGAGIETALYAAADAGDGWAFARLRHALDRARRTGQSPWDAFADLGANLGVNELSELAASVSLAGTHGARIRASLAAKADALRGHQVAETEAAAEAATERMTIPLAVLLLGFMVLIGYPAIEQITTVTASP